jgi:broad specificity phosphatase PhoE
LPLLLVRHAEAGDPNAWTEPDHIRPLTPQGRRQAEALVDLLGAYPITRVLSSPSVRCVQTVEPFAWALGLEMEESSDLEENAGPRALGLIRRLAGSTAALCTHGDVVRSVLDALHDHHGLSIPRGYPCAKGSTWVLEGDKFPPTGARYLPPPAI